MRKWIPVLLALLIISVVGCKPSERQVKDHQTYVSQRMAEVKEINDLARAFNPQKSFKLAYQDEMNGLRGESHTAARTSSHSGWLSAESDALISSDSKIDPAKSTILWWKDRGGTLRETVLPSNKVGFRPQDGGTASVLFRLTLMIPRAAQIALRINTIKAYTDSDMITSELATSLDQCKLSRHNPAKFVEDNLDYAIVFASRRELKEHFHVIVP